MRIQLKLSASAEDDRLIRRWLARYHRGAKRQAVIRACLVQGARAYFDSPPGEPDSEQQLTGGSSDTQDTPFTIPSFANLGKVLSKQTPSSTSTRSQDPSPS